MAQSLQLVEINNRAEWRDWLETHHQQQESILLVVSRKSSGDRYIPYEEIVEEALCFGWIDSTRRTLDDDRNTLLISPRKPRSGWSRVNKGRVQRLFESGKMTPAGMAAIERAKANGSWTRFDAAENLNIPEDLAQALASCKGATATFNAFPPSSRRVMLQWVFDAKRAETRARRVQEIAHKASTGERAR